MTRAESEVAAERSEVADLVLGSAVAARWAACFHAQQAAEKALKAVLVAVGIDFPRTHPLERLADRLGSEADAFDRSVPTDLTPWPVAGRYAASRSGTGRANRMRSHDISIG